MVSNTREVIHEHELLMDTLNEKLSPHIEKNWILNRQPQIGKLVQLKKPNWTRFPLQAQTQDIFSTNSTSIWSLEVSPH